MFYHAIFLYPLFFVNTFVPAKIRKASNSCATRRGTGFQPVENTAKMAVPRFTQPQPLLLRVLLVVGTDHKYGDVDGVTDAVHGLAIYEVAHQPVSVSAKHQKVKALLFNGPDELVDRPAETQIRIRPLNPSLQFLQRAVQDKSGRSNCGDFGFHCRTR